MKAFKPGGAYPTGSIPWHPDNNWGVISATTELARNNSAPLNTTWLLDCDVFPAWYCTSCIVNQDAERCVLQACSELAGLLMRPQRR